MEILPNLTITSDHFHTLFDHSVQGFLVISSTGKITYSNEAAATLLGCESKSLLGSHFLDFQKKLRDKYPQFYPFDENGIDRKAALKPLSVICGKKTVEMRLIPLNPESNPSYLVFLQDMTLRKKIDAKLRNTQLVLDTITRVESKFFLDRELPSLDEALNDILSTTLSTTGSSHGLIARVEQKGDGTYSFPQIHTTHQGWKEGLLEMESDAPTPFDFDKQIMTVLKQRELVRTSLTAISSPYYSKPENHFIGVPLLFDQKLEGIFCITHPENPFNDEAVELLLPLLQITLTLIIGYRQEQEKNAATALLKRARDDALSARSAMSSFLANMSHEIRTPLNILMGMTELLLNTSLNPKQEEMGKKIYGSAELLLALINDSLDLSKIEANQFAIQVIPFNLSEKVSEIISLLKEKATGKGLSLHLNFSKAVPEVLHGDPMRIGQVLTNLLTNAIKYTDQGTVTLDVELRDHHLYFAVTDTGIGIQPENLEHIFDKFYQEDPQKPRRWGGSGLGLAISKQLVELMGGSLHVESTLNKGSKFSFELPL